MAVALLLLWVLCNAIRVNGEESNGQCDHKLKFNPRPHSVSIQEFGAIGDGKTLNTIAFRNAIFYLKSFADKGGAQLYVPPGQWLTGSFNLTSHLTLFLEKDAIILGSQDPSHWGIVEPLPSYGRGIELPGRRYRSLVNGYMLRDVVITGDNGTIDGQGSVWWEWFTSHSLNYTRPHLVEFVSSEYVLVSNISLLNAPAYNIHPVYCSNVHIHNISVYAPPESPYTVGIVPDSSDNICIEDCNISMGHDAIAFKSGWDEYGIAYGRPTTIAHVRRVDLRSSTGSSLAFGSEMSGGISDILVEEVHLYDSLTGIEFRTTTDDKFDPDAFPVLEKITLQNIIGTNITIAGNFKGIEESPFTFICLSNISLSINSTSLSPWQCSYVSGFSESVFPEPCPELMNSSTSSCGILMLELQFYNIIL
ncbi:hypothetical protein ES319_A09G067500v1 [Gossypium barbadense]|uniref:Pectate lyase superfamily protein domain-containing protein n=2 Tax=Gossypium TaxID=3633 RepID=A0A5J5UBD7_GOSBA|nr:hypothetical protein ES319_A09G067500v1 [Gossypium barbadense]TYH01746.1 hypothetical protein ES288_A09G084500v1 [Gossypium darwinii]